MFLETSFSIVRGEIMFFDHIMQQTISLYEKADAICISDKNGYLEYAKWHDDQFFTNGEIVGKHILEIYPALTEETSTIMRCLRTKTAQFDDVQHLETFKGEHLSCISTTYPIIVEDEIIGTLCVSSYFGEKYSRDRKPDHPAKNDRRGLYELSDIVTENEQMKALKAQVFSVARTNSTVLIYGETGTGKELVAESIHTAGERRGKPFIAQNCAAIPHTLLEGLFFGTEKGSFTGAESKQGLFEMAGDGTLFLDEINSMDMAMQSKLLKALEEKTFRRIGGTKNIPIRARILCAMNESPQEVLKCGKIRPDLFYRIGAVQLRLIPLRERREDILPLARHFVEHFNQELGCSVKGLSDLAEHAFLHYSWPGNVREVRNIIESAFNTGCRDQIMVKHLPEYFLESPTEPAPPLSCQTGDLSLPEAVSVYEKALIEHALKAAGNMAGAARMLKISRQSLSYKMEKYGLC